MRFGYLTSRQMGICSPFKNYKNDVVLYVLLRKKIKFQKKKIIILFFFCLFMKDKINVQISLTTVGLSTQFILTKSACKDPISSIIVEHFTRPSCKTWNYIANRWWQSILGALSIIVQLKYWLRYQIKNWILGHNLPL